MTMKPYEIKKNAAAVEIGIKAAIRMRLQYLVSLAGEWDGYLDLKTNVVPALSVPEILDEIDELRKYEKRCDQPERKGSITEEMIQAAKGTPIETVVSFDRCGKSLAFCHTDKSPSLTWHKKANRATCFPCGKSFNAVDVLINRDGLNFIEAVKQLAA